VAYFQHILSWFRVQIEAFSPTVLTEDFAVISHSLRLNAGILGKDRFLKHPFHFIQFHPGDKSQKMKRLRFTFLEYRTMDKVEKRSAADLYAPSSDLFTISKFKSFWEEIIAYFILIWH
jgi:hypothetical protein